MRGSLRRGIVGLLCSDHAQPPHEIPDSPAELQASQESTRALAARYGLNAKTVAKWRQRASTADRPMGPAKPKSTVLTEVEEAIVVEFRRRILLPLDDVLGCL